MIILLRQLRFLPIHFILAGILFFALYCVNIGGKFVLVFLAPAIYLATMLKELLAGVGVTLEESVMVNNLVFLLPVYLIYQGILGFLTRQLMNERGILRILSLVALGGFLTFIHFLAWRQLLNYTLPNI